MVVGPGVTLLGSKPCHSHSNYTYVFAEISFVRELCARYCLRCVTTMEHLVSVALRSPTCLDEKGAMAEVAVWRRLAGLSEEHPVCIGAQYANYASRCHQSPPNGR